ncbi:family 10 glycosylhydrolase [Eubacteriales bacterium DFI.9.88]|nr:family 10 glycosylhydrolase [Eubacteriales bacterium DFI.9.88]
MKRIGIFFMITALLLGGAFTYGPQRPETSFAAAAKGELRGIWVSVFDLPKLGLNASNEAAFIKNADQFLTDAKSNGINTVFLHVRAFDDAIYPSKTFRRNQYVSSSYDPLQLMIQQAHKKGMELHAWMNPYRLDYNYYLDPAQASTSERIKKAVSEVMAYDIDGIHFDDYFYHAEKGYKNVNGTITIQKEQEPSPPVKRANVNAMVSSIYSYIKTKKADAVFGISPQGSLENCRLGGADIDRWISQSGYVDYLMPQIYWSNQWGSKADRAMFSERIAEWKRLNNGRKTLYAGLALYRTGTAISDDPGWMKKSTNLKDQVQILRSSGLAGYTLFSGQDLYRSAAQKELSQLRVLLGLETAPSVPKPIPAQALQVSASSYNSLKLSWKTLPGVSGYQIYRAASKGGTYKKIKTIDKAQTSTYKDSSLVSGKSYYYKIRGYKGSQYGAFSTVKSGTPKPSAPKISVKAGKRSAAIKWKKISGANGYVLYRAAGTKGKFKTIRTIKSGSTIKYTNKKLAKKKKYTFRMRAYRLVKGKRVYSGYSSKVTVRIK